MRVQIPTPQGYTPPPQGYTPPPLVFLEWEMFVYNSGLVDANSNLVAM